MENRMTRDELRDLIRDTVDETLTAMGVQRDSPMEMQRDFQWLRETRLASEAIKRKGILAIVGIALAGLAAAAWVGLKHYVGQSAP